MGKVSPSIWAVLALMTSSTFVDCMTGNSDGFSPLRMRPAGAGTEVGGSREIARVWAARGHSQFDGCGNRQIVFVKSFQELGCRSDASNQQVIAGTGGSELRAGDIQKIQNRRPRN